MNELRKAVIPDNNFFSIKTYSSINKITINGKPYESNKIIEEVGEIILLNYKKYSDILIDISHLYRCREQTYNYRLDSFESTSLLDSEYILSELYNIKIVSDYVYSSISNSFFIQLNPAAIDIHTVIIAGLCSILYQRLGYNNTEIMLDVKLKGKSIDLYTDVLVRYKSKLLSIRVKLAPGLEHLTRFHDKQMNSLVKHILDNDSHENIIKQLFIVTQGTYLLIPNSIKQYIYSINNINDMIEDIIG